MRSGIIAKKLGMTRIFTKEGVHIPVTVMRCESLEVVSQRTLQRDGYLALQIGCGNAKSNNISKAMNGHFKKNKVQAKRKLNEFRVDSENLLSIGTILSVSHFTENQYVDVIGISIGKGFAGAMKRHNFSGLRATHGVSVSHRSHGSTGQCQDPGRVFKGKKMAGHLGAQRVTIQSLKIININESMQILTVKGAVPGHKGNYVFIKDAVKHQLPSLIAKQTVT